MIVKRRQGLVSRARALRTRLLSIFPSAGEAAVSDDAAARLAAIVRSSSDAIIGKTLNGVVTSWNDGAAHLFGYSADEMLGQPILRLIPAGRAAEEDVILAEIAAGKDVKPYETIRLHKDGHAIEVSLSVSPIRNAAGAVIGASKIARDITERKQALRRLAEREAQLRSFIENAPAAVAMFDREMRYIAVSQRFLADYGLLDRGSLIGQSHYDIFPDVPERWRDIHMRVLAGEDISRDEDIFPRANGRVEWVRWSMKPWLDADGNAGGAMLFAEIITGQIEAKRKLAESKARFAAALRAGNLGAFDYDPRTGLIEWDETANRLWGFEEGQPVTYEIFEAGLHPDDKARVRAAIAEALNPAGSRRYECEYRVISRADGKIRWVSAEGDAFFDGEIPCRGIGVLQDITESKQLEKAKRERERRDSFFFELESRLRDAASAKEAVDAASEAIGRELGVAFAGVSELEPGAQHHVMLSVWSDGGTPPLPGESYAVERQASRFAALFDGKGIVVNDATSDERMAGDASKAIYTKLGVRSSIMMPVMRDGRLRAFLFAAGAHPRDWTEAEVSLARETIERCWHAVERARAEAALRESEQRLRLANEAAEIGTFTIDTEAGAAHYSPQLSLLLGVPGVETASVESALARVHRDDVGHVRELYTQALKGANGGHLKMDFRFVRPGGEVRWMTWIGRTHFTETAAGRVPYRIIGACLDVTERKRQEEHVTMLMREVDHRAKNMLTLVQVIARRTAASSGDDFVRRFEERIQALAANQDLLFHDGWRGVNLDTLARSQLSHFKDLVGTRIEIDGPSTYLAPPAAQAIGMALHELATNASKYGALSDPIGRVRVSWTMRHSEDRTEQFHMAWQEMDGPPVQQPVRRGFGSTVLTSLAERGLDAEVELRYERAGLVWRITCPATSLTS
jgi:PAS domain S-box-containing protein